MNNKYRILVVDFMLELGKHPIGGQDSEGNELHIGDILQSDGGGVDSKYMIGYRYGEFILKPPMSMHYIGTSDYSRYTKVDEVWSSPDYRMFEEKAPRFIYGDESELLPSS